MCGCHLEQGFLVAELTVDRCPAYAGGACNPVNAGSIESMLKKLFQRMDEQGFALQLCSGQCGSAG